MTRPITLESTIHFRRRGRGSRRVIASGAALEQHPPGRIPRISKLMALAIRFEGLIRDGSVADYAELARLGHVTRARVTQIMNLRLLSPDIQEDILFMAPILAGRDTIHLQMVQSITQLSDWDKQRQAWWRCTQAVTHKLLVP